MLSPRSDFVPLVAMMRQLLGSGSHTTTTTPPPSTDTEPATSPRNPKPSSTPVICPDILLLVATHLDDLQDLSSLSQTSRFINALLKTYEHSIVKAIVARRIASGLLVPPCGFILASHTQGPSRPLLPAFTFPTVQELNLRSHRTQALFAPSSPLRNAISASQSHAALPKQELANLIAGLSRAVMLADRLADCGPEVAYRAGARHDDPGIKRAVHLAQFDVLRATAPLDLAFLATLGDIGGMAYATMHPYARDDPTPWGRTSAFKECLYRFGSMVLWAHTPAGAGAGGSSEDKIGAEAALVTTGLGWAGKGFEMFTERAVADVLAEIVRWEAGEGAYEEADWGDESLVLPGIHSMIRNVYAGKTGRPLERVGVDMDVAVLMAIKEDGERSSCSD